MKVPALFSPWVKSNVSASQVPQRIITVVAIMIKNSPRHPGYAAALSFIIQWFHCPFQYIVARLLHAGRNKASVLAPRYSCAGLFHPVTRQTDLPKHGAEEVMGNNTLGAPLQKDAQQGA